MTFEEGASFEAWWEKAYGTNIVPEEARLAWNAAVLAERERCLNLVESMYDRNTSLDWNDALEEVSFALRNSM